MGKYKLKLYTFYFLTIALHVAWSVTVLACSAIFHEQIINQAVRGSRQIIIFAAPSGVT
jgi:hypothetical protein